MPEKDEVEVGDGGEGGSRVGMASNVAFVSLNARA